MRRMNKQKKKELFLTLGITGLVLWLAMFFFIIHYQIVVENNPHQHGLFTMIELAIEDIKQYPFSIFPIPGKAIGTTMLITLLAGLMGFIVYASAAARKHDNPDTVQGKQEWLSNIDDYNKRFTDPIGKTSKDGPNNMILSQDIFMCMDNERIRRNLNVFVVGGSGSGKSYSLVGPNIMQANASFVITDPSGGLFKQYGYFLEHMGYKVKCFNLDNMEKGNHYNPFNYIHNDKDIEILVTTLISNTTPPEANKGDPFWEKSETALLVALIAYLFHHTSKKSQNFSNVMRLMRAADIDENDSSAKSPLDHLFDDIEKVDKEDFALKQYKTFKMGAGRTLKGILISCAVRLQAFDLKDVAQLTDTDDIDLDSVGDEKTALFVIIPTGEKTFNFLASLMYSQLFQRLYGYCQSTAEYTQLVVDSDKQVWKTFRAESPEDKKRARAEAEEFLGRVKSGAVIQKNKEYNWYEIRTKEGELVGYRGTEDEAKKALGMLRSGKVIANSDQSNHGERLPIHTRLLLDEFPNTGKIPEFSEKVATIRKYEISVTIIVQSLQQMKNLYKDDWETLTGNCDNTIYLGGGADTVTTEWVSKLLGKETRVVMNANYGKGSGGISLNRTGVELYSPADLRTMPEDECIIIAKSLEGFKGKKYKTDKHPNRPLVLKLNKEKGAYWFNAQKAEDLLTERTNTAKIITDLHGQIVMEEAETVAVRNEDAAQVAAEFADNADIYGDPIVGMPRAIRGDGEGLETTLELSSRRSTHDSLELTMDTNDELWGAEDMMFGSAPAGAL